MLSVIALVLLVSMLPFVWAVVVHRAIALLWPLEKRRAAAWSQRDEQERAGQFLNYQI